MAQSIGGLVDNLFTTCRDTIFAASVGADRNPVLVCLGDPGQYQPATIIGVATDIRMPITRPTGGTGRSRDSEVEIDVVISVLVPGGPEAQQAAIDAALQLQGLLEAYFRTSPNETLGGSCYDARVSNAELQPYVAYQPTQQGDPIPFGRGAANIVTVTANVRY